jgi:hypothetical protein
VGCKSTDEPAWSTAKSCDGGACVQIGIKGESVLIRSSVDPDRVHITLSRDEWLEFLASAKDGDFDGVLALMSCRSGAGTV